MLPRSASWPLSIAAVPLQLRVSGAPHPRAPADGVARRSEAELAREARAVRAAPQPVGKVAPGFATVPAPEQDQPLDRVHERAFRSRFRGHAPSRPHARATGNRPPLARPRRALRWAGCATDGLGYCPGPP